MRTRRGMLLAVFALACLVRFAFVFAVPRENGDWAMYSVVAQNIYDGCGVSVNVPVHCTPHFGGNQLPLFPAMVAAVWRLSGHSDVAVRMVQSILAAFSAVWLCYAVDRFAGRRAAWAVGALVAISPIQSVWAGSLLTETLAIATTQWVLAELLLGHAEGRFRVVGVGVAVAFASWARLDGVLLAFPVIWSAIQLAGPWRGLRGAVLAGLIAAAPSIAWAGRNVAVGISVLPIYGVLPDGTQGPKGYAAWLESWMVDAAQRGPASYFGVSDYQRIKIDPAAYLDAGEKTAVEGLLARLVTFSGQPFPADIDAAFQRLADQHRARQTGVDRLMIYLQRVWALSERWLNPWAPNPGDGRTKTSPSDLYRFIITLGFFLTTLFGFLRSEPKLRLVVAVALVFLVTRLAFFGISGNIELRYTVEFAPFLETVAVIGAAFMIDSSRRRGPVPAR